MPATNNNNEVLQDDDSIGGEINGFCEEDENSTGSGVDDGSSGPSDDSDSLESVLDQLEELLLNEHVDAIKNKLIVFESERRYPGGEIQRLIYQCDWHGDWHGLFAATNSDSRLSIDLFRQGPVVLGAFKDHKKGIVGSGMEKIRDKYFTLSKDADKYIVSKHSRGLSSKKELASGNIRHASHPTLTSTTGEDSDGISW